MKKPFDRRKEDFIGQQTDHDNDYHYSDDLLHGAQFAAIMEKLAKAKTGQDCHENFGGHQGAPGKSPALLHSADDKGKRSRQDDLEPDVESLGPHGQSGARVNWRDVAHAGLGSNYHGPQS